MPEINNEDSEILEAAALLPEALYGTRLYSNTALLALALQRESYQAEIDTLRAQLRKMSAQGDVSRDAETPNGPLHRDNQGLVAVVFALVFAACFLIAVTFQGHRSDRRSEPPPPASLATKTTHLQGTNQPRSSDAASASKIPTAPDRTSQLSATPPPETVDRAGPGHRAASRSLAVQLGRTKKAKASDEAKKLPVAASEQQVASIDTAADIATAPPPGPTQDGGSTTDVPRLPYPASDAIRRRQAIDALHALRMR